MKNNGAKRPPLNEVWRNDVRLQLIISHILVTHAPIISYFLTFFIVKEYGPFFYINKERKQNMREDRLNQIFVEPTMYIGSFILQIFMECLLYDSLMLGRPLLGMQEQTIGHNPAAGESPGQNTLWSNRDNSCVCGWVIQIPCILVTSLWWW